MDAKIQINPISAKFMDVSIAPMHTAEHILNATMVRMLGCGRHVTAHVERTKSKLDYALDRPLTEEEVRAIEAKVNEVISADLPVTVEYAQQSEVADRFNLERLPEGATQTVRIAGHVRLVVHTL